MERRPGRRHQSSRDSTSTNNASTKNHHPSFSSSLLDAIYRSIDEDVVAGGQNNGKKTTEGALPGARGIQPRHVSAGAAAVMKHIDHPTGFLHQAAPYVRREVDVRFTAAAVVERTKTTTVSEKVETVRREFLAEYDQLRRHDGRPLPPRKERLPVNSPSCSSESSYGGFSSSEADSSILPAATRPKPIRTGEPQWRRPGQSNPEGHERKDNSIRSRFRASKLYNELKKAKTPVSPGARLASFLANLFGASGNPKKEKTSKAAGAAGSGGGESGCSSVSSHSRSCLVKTPSTRGRTPQSCGGCGKRSVRFYPVSIVVGEDDKPDYFALGGLSLAEPVLTSVRTREARPSHRASAREEEERNLAGEVATAVARGYTEKKPMGVGGFDVGENVDDEEEEEEEDDTASCASSDLFELENLAAVGGGGGERRFLDELPVYGTTRLETNRAFARGLVV